MARLLHQRGDPVFELDSRGRVLRAHGDDSEHLGIVVRERRIVTYDRLAQAGLERAVAAVVGPLHEPAIRIVVNERGERRFLNLVPITGQARDVFPSTAAVVVIIDPGRQKGGAAPGLMRQAFGLTVREAQIAALLAEGSNLEAIAECLHLGLGTVRNHLKRIFDKTDTGRQGELVALLRSLQL